MVDIYLFVWYTHNMHKEDCIKNLQYQQLFDLYEKLLTDAQREVCYLYFMCDLSLTEIAEQKQVSKQSISTTLQICKQLLEEYEKKLCLLHKQQALVHEFEYLLQQEKIDKNEFLKLKKLI